MTFSNLFHWIVFFVIWTKFPRTLFTSAQLTIIQYNFKYHLGAQQAISLYLNQWCLAYRRMYASLGLDRSNVFLQCRFVYKLDIWMLRTSPFLFCNTCLPCPPRLTCITSHYWILIINYKQTNNIAFFYTIKYYIENWQILWLFHNDLPIS